MTDDELPEGWTHRPTTGADADELLALVNASVLAAAGFADFTAQEVAEGLAGPCSMVAVTADGTIAGWGYLDNPGNGPDDFVEVYAHPEGGRPALRPLLARMLVETARRARERGGEGTVQAGAIPVELPWIEALTAAGFTFVKQHARMQIDLPVPPTGAVPGVTVRPVREDELPEFFAVYDAAFRDTPDYQPTGYDRWRERFVDGHRVRLDEWFVAEADGAVVGVLQSSEQNADSGEGWVKHLAVRAEFRKRGVGRALLAAAFARYLANGRVSAGLGVDLANPTEAIRLYTGVGMRAAYQANIYERPALD
ncbi:GNAT family N-acetyltransferase [Catellatospora methionotrophica]|uniref:GNAT family N-acetyltransferase n=1 Tax=Catellatospora methionotrophica TaxID=121620 RepID=UPI0033ED47B0